MSVRIFDAFSIFAAIFFIWIYFFRLFFVTIEICFRCTFHQMHILPAGDNATCKSYPSEVSSSLDVHWLWSPIKFFSNSSDLSYSDFCELLPCKVFQNQPQNGI